LVPASQAIVADDLFAVVKKVWELFKRQPIIYTGASVWNGSVGKDPRFFGLPVWPAAYLEQLSGDGDPMSTFPTGSFPMPVFHTDPGTLPNFQTSFQFWQFRVAPKGEISGVDANVDLDMFNGSRADLIAKFTGAENPLPPGF
jgi:GH25 family lysozyme M1 (1,4-beta-N-acetylmuramidase)